VLCENLRSREDRGIRNKRTLGAKKGATGGWRNAKGGKRGRGRGRGSGAASSQLFLEARGRRVVIS